MRVKLVFLAIAIVALAIGVTSSNASFRSEVNVKVDIAKPGAPATAKFTIDNTDTDKVPQPITGITITSKVAKFTSNAIPQCKADIPSNDKGTNNAGAISPACQKTSKVGSGTFTANTGTPGQPIPSDLGTISGDVNVYNYKPGPGQQAALLFEILSDIPVPNAHQYQLATVSKSGVLTATLPKMEDLPPVVKDILSPPGAPRVVSVAKLSTTIKSPKPKRGKKAWFTLTNNKHLDFSVVLERN